LGTCKREPKAILTRQQRSGRKGIQHANHGVVVQQSRDLIRGRRGWWRDAIRQQAEGACDVTPERIQQAEVVAT
jgi:hypothetical protein